MTATDCLTAKLLLALASTVVFGSESHGTHDHILLLKSKLFHDWRFTVDQFFLARSPLRITTRYFFYNSTLAVIDLM
jgi:hypothetical protein